MTKHYLRGGICPSRQCRRQCKIFASGVNFSIFTHFLCFFLLKLLKLGEIDGVKFLAWKSDGVKFLTNSMSAPTDLHFSCFFFVLYFCSQQKWMLLEEIYPGHPDHWHWTNFCGNPSQSSSSWVIRDSYKKVGDPGNWRCLLMIENPCDT